MSVRIRYVSFSVLTILLLVGCSHGEQSALNKRYYLLISGTPAQQATQRAYVCDSLKIDSLHASVLNAWIHGWVDSYKQAFAAPGSEDSLSVGARKLIVRISEQSPDQLQAVIRILCDQLVAGGSKDLAANLAAFVNGIDVPIGQLPEIANRLLIQIRLTGNKAPAIAGLQADAYPALVVFYESNCSSCDQLMQTLANQYDELKKQGINVISLSSDEDAALFAKHAKVYPWEHQICDYQGFKSPTFEAWGVAATPSIYYVDRGGTVQEISDLKAFDFLKLP